MQAWCVPAPKGEAEAEAEAEEAEAEEVKEVVEEEAEVDAACTPAPLTAELVYTSSYDRGLEEQLRRARPLV